jgi:succinate--hydroxymethylglutarate CoA-transferase
MLNITGYGGGGPSAKRAGYDVIAGAEAGLLHITGEPNGNPTKPGVGLTDMCTGLYLHGAILAALLGRQTSGVGQKIDASLFETQVSLLANVAMTWLNLGQEAKRWGTAHPSIVPYEAFKTRDRFLVIGAVNNRQFSKLCGLLGNAELLNDVRFVDNDARVRNRKDLKVILDDLFAKKSTDEWLAIFEGSGMPYGPINNMEQVFSHPQTQARDMIETVDYDAAISGKLKLLG